MAAEMMYGKPVAEQIESHVRLGVAEFVRVYQITPRLDIVQVGSSPASTRYVRKKLEACERLGMRAELHLFDETVTGAQLRDEVCRLSHDGDVHGILVQLPLPALIENPDTAGGVDKFDIFDAIAAEKDVDGVSRYSVPALYRARQNEMMFLPCTPLAVLRMLAYYKIETQGKVAVAVGRNDITAKPMHHIFGGRICNATAIWCHRYTPKADHDAFMRQADIVVTSVGNVHYKVTAEMIKPGAVVIDIGTRVDSDGRLRGDMDFDSVKEVASYITPVPKGVGPVTVAALTENLLRAAQFCLGVRKPGYEF
jgi:methylenetetrahydrofolate dehydrogenase (NADP+)/methenyltetrahydrofolate cyclohydrolase